MPRICLILLLTTLILKLVPYRVHAQEKDELAWSAEVEMSFVGTSGNSNTKTLGLGARFDYAPGLWLTETKVSFIRSEAGDTINARSLDTQFRGTRTLHERFGVYTKGEYLSDRFAGIDDRYAVEGGISYSAIPEGFHVHGTRWNRRNAGRCHRESQRDDRQRLRRLGFFRQHATCRRQWTRHQRDWRLTNDLSLLAGHNTTGVTKTNWIQFDVPWGIRSLRRFPIIISAIASTNTGNPSPTPIKNLRVMSVSSVFGNSCNLTLRGSSAIPQIGQAPASTFTISRCIGQVYSISINASAVTAGSSAIPQLGHGTGLVSRTSGHMGHT